MKFVGASGLGRIRMFTVYILQSEKDDSYYIGSTNDLEQRLIKHNKGYSRYTKNKGPFKVIYRERLNSRSDARKREYYLKSLKSRLAIKKLVNGSVV